MRDENCSAAIAQGLAAEVHDVRTAQRSADQQFQRKARRSNFAVVFFSGPGGGFVDQVVAYHAVEDDELLSIALQALPLAHLNAEDARKLVQCQRAAGLPAVTEHVTEEGSRFETEVELLGADCGRVAVEKGKALAYVLAVPSTARAACGGFRRGRAIFARNRAVHERRD